MTHSQPSSSGSSSNQGFIQASQLAIEQDNKLKYQRIKDEARRNGYSSNQINFRLTRRGHFYNQYVEKSNIWAFIDRYIEYREKEEVSQSLIDYVGENKPPHIVLSCTKFATTVADNNKLQEFMAEWMMKMEDFLYIIPGQFKISRPSKIKVSLQFNEQSDFEKHANYQRLINEANGLQIENEPVSITVSGRRRKYNQFKGVIYNLDRSVRPKVDSIQMIEGGIKMYWMNKLIIWFCAGIQQRDGSIIGINLADFVTALVPNYDIASLSYILEAEDIKKGTDLTAIRKYCDFVNRVQSNFLYPLRPPNFVKPYKFDSVMLEMFHEGFVHSIDLSFAKIVGQKQSVSEKDEMNENDAQFRENDGPQTRVTFDVFPGWILGGGPNHIQTPSFIFAMQKHCIYEYHADIVQSFLDSVYPRCSTCILPGFTGNNCERCRNDLDVLRSQKAKQCQSNNVDTKRTRAEIGKCSVKQICYRCSRRGHYGASCSFRPSCYLDYGIHSVLDRRLCGVVKSIKIIFENIWTMHSMKLKPQDYSLYDVLDFVPNTKPLQRKPQPTIPQSLSPSIPQLQSISIAHNNHNNVHALHNQAQRNLSQNDNDISMNIEVVDVQQNKDERKDEIHSLHLDPKNLTLNENNKKDEDDDVDIVNTNSAKPRKQRSLTNHGGNRNTAISTDRSRSRHRISRHKKAKTNHSTSSP